MKQAILTADNGETFFNPEFLDWLTDQLDYRGFRNLASIAQGAIGQWEGSIADIALGLVWLCDNGNVTQSYGNYFALAFPGGQEAEPTDDELIYLEASQYAGGGLQLTPTAIEEVDASSLRVIPESFLGRVWVAFTRPRFSDFQALAMVVVFILLNSVTWIMLAGLEGKIENFSNGGEQLSTPPVEILQPDEIRLENENPFDFAAYTL